MSVWNRAATWRRALRGVCACALLLGAEAAPAQAPPPLAPPAQAAPADEFTALLNAAAHFIRTGEFENAERALQRASALIPVIPSEPNAPPAAPENPAPAYGERSEFEQRAARAQSQNLPREKNAPPAAAENSGPTYDERSEPEQDAARAPSNITPAPGENRARAQSLPREEAAPPAASESLALEDAAPRAPVTSATPARGENSARARRERERALRQHRASAVAFHRGLLASARGRHREASEIFHAMLVRDPRLLRVRLEFARALFLARRDSVARREFERVLAARPPPAVTRNVQRFLDAIRRRRAWSADFAFALLPDSNLNQAPSTRVVEIGGLPFTLSDDAQEQSGLGAHMQLAGGWRLHAGERLRVAATGRVARREYPGHRYDDMTLAASLGPRWLFAGGELGGALLATHRSFGGRSYSRELGVRADLSRALSPRRRLGLQARVGWLRHERESVAQARDGPQWALDLNWREGLRANSTLQMWLRYRRERPRREHLRSRSPTLGVSLAHDFARGISLGLEAQAAFTRFDAASATFENDAIKRRRDRTLVGTLRLQKRDLLFAGFAPVLALTHIRNDSTHVIHRYDRNLLEISLRRAF